MSGSPDTPRSSVLRHSVTLLRELWRMAMQWPWMVRTVMVTLIFFGVALATSAHIGVPIRDPEGALLGKRMVSPILMMLVFTLLDSFRLAVRDRRAQEQPATMSVWRLTLQIFRARWWWKRLVFAIIGFMSFAFTYLAYRNLKSFVSLVNYRTYDPELLRLDQWLLHGHAPGPLLHDLLGTGWAAHVLSSLYLAFIPMVPVAVAAALAFSERMREAYVFVAASMYAWILGTISYYAIPSLGPFAAARDQFKTLPLTGVSKVQQSLIDHRINLHGDPIGYNNVAGVSAFASLHVGIVVMVLVMMIHYRQRVLTVAVALFLIPTTLATIYFGWHFIVDDLAGIFLGWFAVVLARYTIYPPPLLRAIVNRIRRRDPEPDVVAPGA